MNYKPYAGYWFYGGTDATQRANFYASYGLIASLPTPSETISSVIKIFGRRMLMWINGWQSGFGWRKL